MLRRKEKEGWQEGEIHHTLTHHVHMGELTRKRTHSLTHTHTHTHTLSLSPRVRPYLAGSATNHFGGAADVHLLPTWRDHLLPHPHGERNPKRRGVCPL